VHAVSVPVATDVWTAHAAAEARGAGCELARGADGGGLRAPISAAIALLAALHARARRRRAATRRKTERRPLTPRPR
jgi:hypothetical protein